MAAGWRQGVGTALILLTLTACGGHASQPTAAQLAGALQRQGLPVGHVEVETAESDNFGLLGAPGQYTSAVEFQDTRLAQQGSVFNYQERRDEGLVPCPRLKQS
jgi:hypothetical protein